MHGVQIDVRCGCLLHRDFPPLPGHACLKWPYALNAVLNPHRLLITPKCPRSWVACRFPFHLVDCFQLHPCSADYHLWGSQLREERLVDRKGRIVQKSVVFLDCCLRSPLRSPQSSNHLFNEVFLPKKLTLVLFDDKRISSWRLHKTIKKKAHFYHIVPLLFKIKWFDQIIHIFIKNEVHYWLQCSVISSVFRKSSSEFQPPCAPAWGARFRLTGSQWTRLQPSSTLQWKVPSLLCSSTDWLTLMASCLWQ